MDNSEAGKQKVPEAGKQKVPEAFETVKQKVPNVVSMCTQHESWKAATYSLAVDILLNLQLKGGHMSAEHKDLRYAVYRLAMTLCHDSKNFLIKKDLKNRNVENLMKVLGLSKKDIADREIAKSSTVGDDVKMFEALALKNVVINSTIPVKDFTSFVRQNTDLVIGKKRARKESVELEIFKDLDADEDEDAEPKPKKSKKDPSQSSQEICDELSDALSEFDLDDCSCGVTLCFCASAAAATAFVQKAYAMKKARFLIALKTALASYHKKDLKAMLNQQKNKANE
jgi:hypothetical protein